MTIQLRVAEGSLNFIYEISQVYEIDVMNSVDERVINLKDDFLLYTL